MAKIFKLAVAETFYNCSFSFLLLTAVAEAFGLPIRICVSLCIVQSRIEIFTYSCINSDCCGQLENILWVRTSPFSENLIGSAVSKSAGDFRDKSNNTYFGFSTQIA
jgi:hypothetical protein